MASGSRIRIRDLSFEGFARTPRNGTAQAAKDVPIFCAAGRHGKKRTLVLRMITAEPGPRGCLGQDVGSLHRKDIRRRGNVFKAVEATFVVASLLSTKEYIYR
jgi:hypothetical protein